MTHGPSWWKTSDGAPPLYATPRNPHAWTDGPQVAAIARSLGTPLLPWQRHVADVANERRADGSYEYQVIVVSVPRQTGKTTLLRAQGVHRCLVCGRDVFYTAQTGKDARARWTDLINVLRVHPALSDRVKIGLRGGAEQVAFLDSGAAFHVFAPTPESLHGYTPPSVFVDEAFALGAAAGELLMGAIGPAQITVNDKQIWIVSTAGHAESTFLHDWIDRALGGMPRVALFLWGAGDELSPYVLGDIEQFHPGVGFALNGKVLEAADVLAEADRMSRAEYERAFGNRRTVTLSHLIPTDAWRALGPPARELVAPSSTRDVVLAYDVALDRQSSTITATWRQPDGRLGARIVRREPGTAWLADAVHELDTAWRPAALGAIGNGPVLDVTAELVDRGLDVSVLAERDYAAATGLVLSLIDDDQLTHDGDTALEVSVTGLVTRGAAGDGVAFSRRHSVGDSSAAVAMTAGAWLVTRGAVAAGPLIYFPETG